MAHPAAPRGRRTVRHVSELTCPTEEVDMRFVYLLGMFSPFIVLTAVLLAR